MRKLLLVSAVVLSCGAAWSQSEVVDPEARLAEAHGAERVPILNELARQTQSNDPKRSLEYAEQARALAGEVGNEEGRARALNNLGIGHYFLAEYGLALKFYEESLALAESIGHEECVADALNNIGVIHYVWGEYDETLQYYSRTLDLRRKLGDKTKLAVSYNNLGNIYHATGRYEEALDLLTEALLLYEEAGDDSRVASTLNNIGLAYYKLERHDEALSRFDRALAIGERIDDKSGLALTLNNLGMSYGSQGRYAESLEHHRRSLAVREQIGDRQGAAMSRHNLGRSYAMLGRYDRALEQLTAALELAQEIDVKEIQRDVCLTLSGTHERMGDTARALEFHKRYKEVDDELLSEQTARQLAEWQARYEVEKKDLEIAVLRTDREAQRFARNVTLGGSVLLVALVVLLYNRYRLKSRANLEMLKANEALKLAHAEQEKAARAELAHVSRVAVMGELATALAHELNQPLTAILSNAQAMQRMIASGRAGNDEIGEALADIADGAGRAREIIRRLRALVRRGEIRRERLEVGEVLRDVERIAGADAERCGVELVLDVPPGLPAVSGDPIQLQQVVLNLVHNGVEAMGEPAGFARRIVLSARPDDGDGVLVAVSDSGPGLDDDGIARMFEPFYTTRPNGLGMGLPICQSIIEAHDGRLWATRNPDRGLTVQFSIPPSAPSA